MEAAELHVMLETPIMDEQLLHPSRDFTADAEVKIIRVVYGANAIIHLLSSMLGAGFYVARTHIGALMAVPIVLTVLMYQVLVVMTLAGNKWHKAQVATIVAFALGLMLTVGFLSAFLNDIAPLLVTTNLFVASVAVVACSFIRGSLLTRGRLGLIVGLLSLIVWLVGFYAFVEEGDWLTAFLIAVVVVLVDFYYVWAIDGFGEYHLGEMIYATASFLTAPQTGPIRWLLGKCRRRQPELSPEEFTVMEEPPKE